MSPEMVIYYDDVGTFAYTESGHFDATCTQPEKTMYTVSFSYYGRSYSGTNTYLGEPALGHDWGEWVNNGDTHYHLCQRDGCNTREEVAHSGGTATCVSKPICIICEHEYGSPNPDAHNWSGWINDNDGNVHYRVCREPQCGKMEDQPHSWSNWEISETEHQRECGDCKATETQSHSGGAATCVKGPICKKCGYEYGSPDPVNGHSWDTGWTSNGGDTHWHKCLNPGCLERDGEENHTSETVPAVPATCDEGGLSEYTRCSKCEMLLSDQEEYMSLGHELTPVAKVEPTCTTPGTEAYWKCTRDGCGKLFSDADGKNETSLEALTIPALGHDWATELTKGETTHYYACSRCDERKDEAAHTGGTATCKAKAKCTVCGGEYGELAEHQYHPNVWYHDENDHWHRCNVCGQDSPHESHSGGTPTCTEKGMCEICGSRYVNALGHEIVLTRPVYPTCTEPGMMKYSECTRCGKPFRDSAGTQEGRIMSATGHRLTPVAKVEPSCTTPGTEAYWQCTRCDKLFSDAEGKNEITAPAAIEALGHQLSPVAKVEPSCTTPGAEAYWKCTRDGCGMLFSDAGGKNEITAPAAIEALGHTEVVDAAVEATCTETGLTVGKHCSVCSEVLVKQDEVAALGHNYTETGRTITLITYTCQRCGNSYSVYNQLSKNTISGLVRDNANDYMDYTASVSGGHGNRYLSITPDLKTEEDLYKATILYLKPEYIEQWLTQGITTVSFRRAIPGNGNAILEINLAEAKNYRQWFTPNILDTENPDHLSFVLTPSLDGSQMSVFVKAAFDYSSRKAKQFSGITLSTVTIETETRETNEPSIAHQEEYNPGGTRINETLQQADPSFLNTGGADKDPDGGHTRDADNEYYFGFAGTHPISITLGENENEQFKALFKGDNRYYTPSATETSAKTELELGVSRLETIAESAGYSPIFPHDQPFTGEFQGRDLDQTMPAEKTAVFADGFSLGANHTLTVKGTLIG